MEREQESAPAGIEIKPQAPARARHICRHGDSPRLEHQNLFLVGIGGCGMSGLARLLRARGASVGGCDATDSIASRALVDDGIAVAIEAETTELPDACDLVVLSAAIRPDHPLVLDAQRRGISLLAYAEMLGVLMRTATGIAIAGTHGKSTTTAMLGAVLVDEGLDPSVIVGATCAQLVGGAIGSPVFAAPAGYRVGSNVVPTGPYADRPGLLLAEACEFNRSFHNLNPTVAAITSVEEDHMDIYGSIDAIIEAFHEFATLVPDADQGGVLLIAHDGAHRREVTKGLRCRVETIGFSPGADWVVRYEPTDAMVTLSRGSETMGRWASHMPGEHNAMNAAFAAVLAIMLGASPAGAARSLGAFRGIDRRMQLLGERPHPGGGSIRVYDDYGHHPTEVDATLRALREFERPQDRGGRLVCVFQPHQHSRTRFFLDEFASALSQADVVVVPHIYFVRDSQEERHKVTAKDLVDRLRQRGVRAMHLYPFEAIVEQLENLCKPNDLLVVMGAGPVWKVAHGFLGWDHEAAGVSEPPAP